ncbi:MAG: hypothetical protein NC453_01355 [Muribaculum sp.]|nr:hypothetical protein [Muribaculum sp.]
MNNTDNRADFVRNQCTFYASWEDAISILKKREGDILRCAIIRSLLYGEDFEDEIEKLSKAARIAWKTIAPLIKSARKKAESGSVSKVNNPKGNNQHHGSSEYYGKEMDKTEDNTEDKTEDKNIKIKSKNKIKHKSVCNTRTHDETLSTDDEMRLSNFDRLLAENAPTFAKSVPPITLRELNYLRYNASADDIIEVMQEIENKVSAAGNRKYGNVATTIKTYLQSKQLWEK